MCAEDAVSGSLWLSRRLCALRAFSFPLSLLPVLVATAAAVRPAHWRWDILIVSALAVMLLHGAGNLLNDYFDYLAGADRELASDHGRPGRLLVSGELSPAEVLSEAIACLALAAPAGAYLLWQCGPQLLAFVVPAGLALYAYTGPPFRLKYRALGEPLIFLVFGPFLMMGAAYAQAGGVPRSVFLLSIPVGLATTAVLLGNNIRDVEEDDAASVVTLPHLLGRKPSRVLYAGLLIAAVLGTALLGALRLGPRFLMASPILPVFHMDCLIRVWRGERIPDIDARTARFETMLLLFLFVVFVLAPVPE